MNEILSDAKKIIHNAIQASLPDEAVKKFIGGKTFALKKGDCHCHRQSGLEHGKGGGGKYPPQD